MARSTFSLTGLGLAALALTACAATTPPPIPAKKPAAAGAAVEKPHYEVGQPYEIKGVTYYPAEDWSYEETGVASWYGDEFQGKLTANGEVFDENEVTAAHRTLPLPSIVQVTDIANGRSIEVRVNDRGPYDDNRILDLSRRAAQLLGYEEQGTVQVRVQLLFQQSLAAAKLAGRKPPDPQDPAQIAKPAPPVTTEKVSQTAIPGEIYASSEAP